MFADVNPYIDLELPLSKQPKRLQTRVIDYFDAFTLYKNERTKVVPKGIKGFYQLSAIHMNI